jgi:hypothetical protein
MGYRKIGVLVLFVAIVAVILVLSQSGYSGQKLYLTHILYQPAPPKGISVISGNLIWYYDNESNTNVLLNVTNYSSIISVVKGQKIAFTGITGPGRGNATINSSHDLNNSFLVNTFIVTNTGDLSIVSEYSPPTPSTGAYLLSLIYYAALIVIIIVIIVVIILSIRKRN